MNVLQNPLWTHLGSMFEIPFRKTLKIQTKRILTSKMKKDQISNYEMKKILDLNQNLLQFTKILGHTS